MATFNREIAQANFAAMSNAELERVLSVGRDEYAPEALELAKVERTRRGTTDDVPEAQPPSEEATTPGLVWLDVYAAIMAMGAIGNPAAAAIRGERLSVVGIKAVFGALVLALAVGLRRRQRWAWWANWLALAVVWAPFSTWQAAAFVAAVWFVPNAVYFAKRKGSFDRASQA